MNRSKELVVIIMAGGMGRRFGGPWKPFVEICGSRVVERIARLARIFGRVYIAITPATRIYAGELCREFRCIETRGAGYPEDLSEALRIAGTPALILPSDMPFISSRRLSDFIEKALSSGYPVATMRSCRDSVCEPLGVSLMMEPGGSWINIDYQHDTDLMDIDTREDLEEARRKCGSMVEG